MFNLLSIVCVLAVFQHGTATPTRFGDAEEVLEECRSSYTGDLSNDFLTGDWFMVSRYTFFGGLVPSSSCMHYIIHKATAENITAFENVYGEDIKLEDNPMLVESKGWSVDLIVKNVEAKEFFGQPTVFAPQRSVYNYKRLSDDFILVWNCALRGRTIDLHSRIQHPTNEEIALVTAGVSEISNLVSQRFCWVF